MWIYYILKILQIWFIYLSPFNIKLLFCFFLKTIMCHTLVEWPWPESYGVIFIISYLTLSVIFLVHFIQWYHCIILDCCQVFTPVYYWASLPLLFSFSRHSKFCLHLFHFVTSYWSFTFLLFIFSLKYTL